MIAISKRMQWIRIVEEDRKDMFENVLIEVNVNGLPGIIRGWRVDEHSFLHIGSLVLVNDYTSNSFSAEYTSDDQHVELTYRERKKIRELVQKFRCVLTDEENQSQGFYRSDNGGEFKWISHAALVQLLNEHHAPHVAARIQQSIQTGTPYRLKDSLILSVGAYNLMERGGNTGVCEKTYK